MLGMTIASLVIAAAQTAYGGYMAYRNGKTQAEASKRAASMAEAQGAAEAASLAQQAKIARQQAVNEQIKGDDEAAKRYRLLATDIGSAYANYAGNGLLVDGATNDTLGDVLRTTTTEGVADVDIIKKNAAMNVWTYQQTAKNYDMNAASALSLAKMQAREYRTAAKQARHQGKLGLWQLFTGAPLVSNNGMGTAMAGMSMMGSVSKSPSGGGYNTNNVYAWNTTGGFNSSNMA